MPHTKVKSDSHGLFVRTDGMVFRPQPARTSHPHPNACQGESIFVSGDVVSVNHITQSPLCSVSNSTGRQLWHSHGVYLSPYRRSNECWNPRS